MSYNDDYFNRRYEDQRYQRMLEDRSFNDKLYEKQLADRSFQDQRFEEAKEEARRQETRNLQKWSLLPTLSQYNPSEVQTRPQRSVSLISKIGKLTLLAAVVFLVNEFSKTTSEPVEFGDEEV